jgi:hypothetical protein
MNRPTQAAGLHILQHALGMDVYGRGTGYRNHFVTGASSVDHTTCMDLVQMGLMTCRDGNAISGGDDIFYVTPAGKVYVQEHSAKPPKLTRSQKRYESYLAADSDMSFGEWMKSAGATA